MASAAQLEAFAWWLNQSPDKRRSRDIQSRFGIAEATANKWLAQFNAKLSSVAGEATRILLREFRAEYEVAQLRTMAAIPKLVAAVEHNLAVITENTVKGELIDPDLLGKTASVLKAVYSLAESASGADVAKRKAASSGDHGGQNGDSRLPDLSAFFDAHEASREELTE